MLNTNLFPVPNSCDVHVTFSVCVCNKQYDQPLPKLASSVSVVVGQEWLEWHPQ